METEAELTETQVATIARALADPRRYAILADIASSDGHLPCACLAEGKKVSAATISHHIKELEAAGLIETVRDGKFINLIFRRDILAAYAARLSDIGKRTKL